MAKIKTYLTTVTVTQTVVQQIKAANGSEAVEKLKASVNAQGLIKPFEFTAADASEIVTIYQTGDK